MRLNDRLIDHIPGDAGDLGYGPIFMRNGTDRSKADAVDGLLAEPNGSARWFPGSGEAAGVRS
jgi:hypothetical protein